MINSSSNKKIIKKHYLPFITHPRPQPLTTYAHKQQVKAQDEMLSEKVWKPDKGGYVNNNKDDTESDDSDDSEGRKNNNKEQQRDYVRIQEGAIIPEPIDDREYMELALDTGISYLRPLASLTVDSGAKKRRIFGRRKGEERTTEGRSR